MTDIRRIIQQVIVEKCGPGWEVYAPDLAEAILEAFKRHQLDIMSKASTVSTYSSWAEYDHFRDRDGRLWAKRPKYSIK